MPLGMPFGGVQRNASRLVLTGPVDARMTAKVAAISVNAPSLEIVLSTRGGYVAEGEAISAILKRFGERCSITISGECSSSGLMILSSVRGRREALRSAIFSWHRSSVATLRPEVHGRLTPARLNDIAGEIRHDNRMVRNQMARNFARGADDAAILARISVWEASEHTATAEQMLQAGLIDRVRGR
jgi:ATP-dependent protease ClpP protease subunit